MVTILTIARSYQMLHHIDLLIGLGRWPSWISLNIVFDGLYEFSDPKNIYKVVKILTIACSYQLLHPIDLLIGLGRRPSWISLNIIFDGLYEFSDPKTYKKWSRS